MHSLSFFLCRPLSIQDTFSFYFLSRTISLKYFSVDCGPSQTRGKPYKAVFLANKPRLVLRAVWRNNPSCRLARPCISSGNAAWILLSAFQTFVRGCHLQENLRGVCSEPRRSRPRLPSRAIFDGGETLLFICIYITFIVLIVLIFEAIKPIWWL